MLLENNKNINESTNEILSDASDSDSVLICFLSAVLFILMILAADTKFSSVIFVIQQQLIIIFSKVNHFNFLSIMQKKYDRKIKKSANDLNSDSDHIFQK